MLLTAFVDTRGNASIIPCAAIWLNKHATLHGTNNFVAAQVTTLNLHRTQVASAGTSVSPCAGTSASPCAGTSAKPCAGTSAGTSASAAQRHKHFCYAGGGGGQKKKTWNNMQKCTILLSSNCFTKNKHGSINFEPFSTTTTTW